MKLKVRAWIGGICGSISLVAAGVLTYLIFAVTPMQETYVYELGESVSQEKTDYFSGVNWAVNLWDFDFSEVNQARTGTYTVTASRLFQTKTYEIVIEDTTAPEITLEEGPHYFKVGTNVSVEELVAAVTDMDAETDFAFLEDEWETDYFSDDTTGEKHLIICAWDSSGNMSKVPVTIVLDTAPEIGGIREFYLACGYDTDYLEGITAIDTVDGDVSGSVTVDKGDLDTDTVGEYEIVYLVTDSYGLCEEESTTVYVMEPLDLQREINTHKINRHDQTIVGAINLYDSGYYEEDNVDFIIEEMTSTRVRIRFDRSDGYWSFGSGYIIKMNEDEIILGTNHHVISGRDKWDVYFHDGAKVEGTVIGSNKAKDIAFVRVNSADVPKETFDTLQTVHINKGYWDSLENDAGIALCIRCIDNNGGVWRDRTGKMNQKMLVPGTMPELPETDNETWTSLAQFHGCSGSAILDGHGNLIAMSVSIATYYGKTYQLAVNLEEILKAYEEIVGECAYYE